MSCSVLTNLYLILIECITGVMTSDFIIQFVLLMLNPLQRLSSVVDLANFIALSDVCLYFILLSLFVGVCYGYFY